MKKNITINMFGNLYAIDEDAYDLLRTYEDSLRSYFSKRSDGQEIIDDIEARIVELFEEQREQGCAAISIEQMQQIISRLGNPQEMEAEDEKPTPDAATASSASQSINQSASQSAAKHRRLYRDSSDRKLTGLLAGIGQFTNTDPLYIRIGLVAIVAFTFFFLPNWRVNYNEWAILAFWVICYAIVAFLTPSADTPETRLRQRGQEVSPENIAQEVAAESQRQQEQGAAASNPGCVGGFFNIVWAVIRFVFSACLFCAVIALIYWSVLEIIMLTTSYNEHLLDHELYLAMRELPVAAILNALACLLLAAAIIYRMMHSLFRSAQKTPAMGGLQRRLWVASIVGSLLCILVTSINLLVRCQNIRTEQAQKLWEQMHEDRTVEYKGAAIRAVDAKFLNDHDWHVVKAENCSEHRVTSMNEYFLPSQLNARYLDAFEAEGRQQLRIERTDSTGAPGTYTLTANVRSDGAGAVIYAIADGKTYSANIPSYSNVGGTLWLEAYKQIVIVTSDSVYNEQYSRQTARNVEIRNANEGRGYGWCSVSIPAIKSKDGIIRYGFAIGSSFTGQSFAGTWASATDFRLEKQ